MSTHKQWVQHPDSIIIAGMYIHCLPVTKLYTPGFIGWWTVAPSVFDSIRTHKFLSDRQEKTVTVVPRFGQRRTASQPPLKSARTEVTMLGDSTSVSSSSPDVAGTDEWTCKTCEQVMKDGNQYWKQCTKCGQWRTDEYEPTKYWPKFLDEAD